ncbi:MAG: hypothetical protein KF687_04685 [Cyclobacteriaceae bacterium]|nr:hypothetical protein [Cyclobacteriaceae bacterium]
MTIFKSHSFFSTVMLTLLPVLLHAQELKTFRGKYSLNGSTTGNATYTYYVMPDGEHQPHGRFSFTSDVMQQDDQIRQLNISGTYRRGNKSGDWSYETSNFVIKFKRITGTSAESILDGTIHKLRAKYNDGLADGRWTLTVQRVKESKPVPPLSTASMSFVNGNPTDKFIFNDPVSHAPLQIEGGFDKKGYFDGQWKMIYTHDDVKYEENREYLSGFLLTLALKHRDTQETIYSISFDDVKFKLDQIAQKHENALGYGDRKFGVLFNDGYTESDEKITAQQTGNHVLQLVLNNFIDSSGIYFSMPGFTRPETGFTRRFQYIYPEKENELIEILNPIMDRMEHQYDSIWNEPVLRLNQQRYDTLAYYSTLLRLGIEKIDVVREVLAEVESGKFDYEFRDNFYRLGVLGLDGIDSVKFSHRGRSVVWMLELNDKVVSPDSLVLNLYRYIIGLDAYISKYYDLVSPRLNELLQESRLAKSDETIIKSLDTLFITYIGDPLLVYNESDEVLRSKKDINDLQLEIFKRYTRNILQRKMQEYVDTQDYNLRLTRGTVILDIIHALIEVYPKLERIPQLEGELDKAFIRYTPNPFFPRDLETRVKTGIYNKGAEVLLPNMIEELKKTSTAEDLRDKVEAIFRLDARLRELAEADDQETNRLNARIRRENQPERIRRLLGV